jgi:hypothetical protein
MAKRRVIGLAARALLLAATAGVVIIGLGASAFGAEPPAAISCGSVITESTTLTRNLKDCTDGLELAGTGITLDLGGHTLAGTGDTGVGIRITGDEVTIKNGRITGFGVGVGVHSLGDPQEFIPAPIFHLDRISVVENTTGVSAVAFIVAFPGPDSTIVSSDIEHNTAFGISINRARLAVIGSSIRGNGSHGVRQFEAVSRYENADVSNNGGDGISAQEGYSVRLIDSTLNHNGGSGLYYFDHYPDPLPYLEGNRANGNAVLGFQIREYWGGSWDGIDGGGNIAKHNGDERQCVVEGLIFGNPAPPDALVCSKSGSDL